MTASTSEAGMDPVADLLGGGRTVAYKAVLAHACGGATVGLLLSQFWYWTSQSSVRERDGWFWKTMDEITEETGLTRTEQETARRKLKENGILLEEFRDLPRKLYFRLNKQRLYDLLRQHAVRESPGADGTSDAAVYNAENPHYGGTKTRIMERRKPAGSKRENPQALKEKMTTEMTLKMTTTKRPAAPQATMLSLLEAPVAAVSSDEVAKMTQLLVTAGVGYSMSRRLATEKPDECRRQLEYLPFITSFKSSKGAYLRSAIEQGFGPPPAYEAAQEAARKTENKRTKQSVISETLREADQQAEVKRALVEQEKSRLQAEEPDRWQQIVAEAEKLLPQPLRGKTSHVAYAGALNGNIDRIVSRNETASHARTSV